MKMNNKAAALLAVGAAMSGQSLTMRGDGENVEMFMPQKPRFASDALRVERIKNDSRAKQAAKQMRRAARWSTPNLYNLFACERCAENPVFKQKGGDEYGFKCACRGYVLSKKDWQARNRIN